MRGGLRDVLKTAIAAALATVVVALPAPAAATSGPLLALSVAPQRSNPANLVLTAQLQGGSTMSKESIDFFVVSTQFGRALNVAIGTATLGRDGKASIIYTPTWSGETQFVARLSGVPAKDAPTATASYRVLAAGVGPLRSAANPARPFLFIGEPFLGVLLAIVGLVWITLIVTLLAVMRGLPRRAGHTV